MPGCVCLGVEQGGGLHTPGPVPSHPQHLLVAVLRPAGAHHAGAGPREVGLIPLGGPGAGGGGGHTLLPRAIILVI